MSKICTRDINQAAIALAAGLSVETLRQAAARRCVFYRALIDQYERRECLPLPASAMLQARTGLYHEAARALREAL